MKKNGSVNKLAESKVKRSSRCRCFVSGCESKYNKILSFFKFPKDKALQKLWKIKCRIKESINQKLIICENHFEKKEYFAGNYIRFNIVSASNYDFK